MAEALRLAEKGIGLTSPNPAVGAVVVKNGRVIGRGWHKKAGEAHAEVEALDTAGEGATGADLYCTLEPCNHRGRTGPCTERIIKSGIKRVFFGSPDPNPAVRGGGASRLKRAGVATSGGLLARECDTLNRAFFKWSVTGLPWVMLKAATTMDGKIASRSGDSRWISSEESRVTAHRLRFESDAVMVGAGTVLHDNPSLTVRTPGLAGKKKPLRVVLDWCLEVGPGARMYRDGQGPVLVVTSRESPAGKAAELKSRGVEVLRLPAACGKADLKKLLLELGRRNVLSLLVEGGSQVHGAFADSRLYDEVHLFMAPMIMGGAGARPFVAGDGVSTVKSAQRLAMHSIEMSGGDIYVVARRADVHRAG
jgi:diaminohydroxyphosphoribosylaminopyrimidine deaminase/5-amino-6-(5-phosphoribosylamino)uracil reductase